MNVAILVPRRADRGHRDRLWKFCRQRWATQFPEWRIVEGSHDDGPFNRSVAVNAAALAAGTWDVAVIIDSDIIANPEAVASAVDVAHSTGRMVVSHNARIMLNKVGTDKVLAGFTGSWRVKQYVEVVWEDHGPHTANNVSSCIAVPRVLWDTVGGFPERMSGWGHEDSVFAICCDTLGPGPHVQLTSELFHLWHDLQPEAKARATHPLTLANRALWERFQAAAGDAEAVRSLLTEPELGPSRIPRILHRTVPAETSEQVEAWWKQFQKLHPGWEFKTYREPINPKDWPLTGDLFKRCANGAQKAGLIRLECLVRDGGFYVDSDVEPVRSLEPLLHLPAVAAWEDENCVPDAVLGCEPAHPAFALMIEKARGSIEGGGDAWQSGPGVTTETLPNRSDVLVLPPGAFFPYHYLQKNHPDTNDGPWVFARHHWHGSWLSDPARKSIERRQRA